MPSTTTSSFLHVRRATSSARCSCRRRSSASGSPEGEIGSWHHLLKRPRRRQRRRHPADPSSLRGVFFRLAEWEPPGAPSGARAHPLARPTGSPLAARSDELLALGQQRFFPGGPTRPSAFSNGRPMGRLETHVQWTGRRTSAFKRETRARTPAHTQRQL